METLSSPSPHRFRDRSLIIIPIAGILLIASVLCLPPPLTPEGDPTLFDRVLLALLIAFLVMILFFVIRTLVAPFFKSIRRDIRAHPGREALWVIASLVCLFSFTATGHPNPNSRGMRNARTRAELNQIYTAILAYKTEFGVLPENTSNRDLLKTLEGNNPRKIEFLYPSRWELNDQNEMVDGWGTAIRILFPPPGRIRVASPGADKIWGNPDDLSDGNE